MSEPRSAAARAAALRVVLVDPGEALEESLAAALAESAEGDRFRLARVGTVAEAIEAAGRDGADLLLLPLPGAEPGAFRVVELRTGAPEVPVVALAGAGDEPLALKAVQLGATDYLITDRLYGTLLVRCLLHAVEVEKVRARLARYQSQWPASLSPENDPRAAAATLRAALPRQFAALAGDYRRLLDRAVEQTIYRVDHPLEREVRGLAERAGDLRAGPRDLVEIHTAALAAAEREEGPQRYRLYVAEGRMRLLELMGHLVTYYRRLSLPGRHSPG